MRGPGKRRRLSPSASRNAPASTSSTAPRTRSRCPPPSAPCAWTLTRAPSRCRAPSRYGDTAPTGARRPPGSEEEEVMRTPFAALALLLASRVPRGAAAEKPMTDKPLDASYLREHALTGGFQLGRPVRPQPTPDGKAVLFLRSPPRVRLLHLYEHDVAGGKTRLLLTPEQLLGGAEEHLSAEEKARRERQRVGVGGFTHFQLSPDGAQILVTLSGKLYLLTRASGAVKELKTGAGVLLTPHFSPDGRHLAYVLDHDLYVLDLDGQ